MKRFAVCALFFLLAASSARAQLGVTSVSPAGNTIDAPTATSIAIGFTADVDAATVTAQSFRVYGRWSGVATGGLTVTGAQIVFELERPFFPGEMVVVHLSSAIQSTVGDLLDAGYMWAFWTRSTPGSGIFVLDDVLSTRLPGEGLIQSYGAYGGDLDRDGSPDLSIPNEIASDVRIMRNDGCGDFGTPELHPLPAFSVPSSNEGQDFNGDGWIDFAVANQVGDTIGVFLGDGAGSYLPAMTAPSGVQPRAVAVLDVEADGDIDLAIAHRDSSNVAIHRNLGDGTFAAPIYFDGGGAGETSIVAVDANNDGIEDLFVGCFDSRDVNTLLGGAPGGGFTLVPGQGVPGPPWMLAAGDVDGDGIVDAATCNSNFFGGTGSILLGDGAGGFLPTQSYGAGAFPLAVDLGDIDGDGDLDLLISNYGDATYTVYQNDGTGAMVSPITLTSTFAGSCAIVVDYDRDGDMDIIGIDEISDEIFLYEQVNTLPTGVQAGSCSARLRIDNLAGWGGYGGSVQHEVKIGGRVFFGITAEPNATYVFAVGSVLEPGLGTPYGIQNVIGFMLLGSGATNAFGEAVEAIDVPAELSPGAVYGFQGYAIGGGGVELTNPEALILVP
ncbi:MAG: FG-GAP-like repeat-containing protein [Planctomycetota bacterium]|nr:FG-GAP-like repeat-containing protein [Planctomycetota bacterium]